MIYLIYGLVGGLVLTWLVKMLIKNVWVAAIVCIIIANIILLILGTIDSYFAIGSIVGGVIIALIPNKGK